MENNIESAKQAAKAIKEKQPQAVVFWDGEKIHVGLGNNKAVIPSNWVKL